MKDLMINEQKNVEIIPKENFLKEAISNDQIILKNDEKKSIIIKQGILIYYNRFDF